MSLAGLAVSFNGALRVLAGALSVFFRARAFGISTLIIGLLSTVTCLCLPTSVALCIYGLRVYLSQDVRRAYAMRAHGASVDDVVRAWGAAGAVDGAGT
jgi:hypothetical protein